MALLYIHVNKTMSKLPLYLKGLILILVYQSSLNICYKVFCDDRIRYKGNQIMRPFWLPKSEIT